MRMTPRVTLRALATASLLWSVFFASRTAATAAAAAPAWWRASHLRVDVESKSELELLAQLAVLLMPDEPIEELFRRFPTPEGSTWGHEELLPDLAAYGVLKDRDAALFVEYDGHPHHERQRGVRRDLRKSAALLRVASNSSVVVRVGHTMSNPQTPLNPQVIYVAVPTWQRDED
ncbi:Mercuric reductase [Durusdinium trenchii]|uniref:Mercuric reductase n=1 Tax=Durusdinium trenchii TaxID=1381693 RepID=A0ABP0HGI9_9DINO